MKLHLLCIIGLIALAACNDGEGRYPQSASYSECINTPKSDIDSENSALFGKQYLTYEVTKEYSLKLQVHNVSMNCAVEGVEAIIDPNGKNDITIHFEWWGDQANCMCPRTITYTLDNLEKGADYHFTVDVSLRNAPAEGSVSFDIKKLSPHMGEGRIAFD